MFKRISFDYSDTTVLITGGSNGIGHACAKAYQDAGATVIITGRQKSASDYDNDLQGLQYHQLELDSTGNIDSLFSSLSSFLRFGRHCINARRWASDCRSNSGLTLRLRAAVNKGFTDVQVVDRSHHHWV